MASNKSYRITVYNAQQYPVGAGGFAFPPLRERTVEVTGGSQLSEIGSHVHLTIKKQTELRGDAKIVEEVADLRALHTAEAERIEAETNKGTQPASVLIPRLSRDADVADLFTDDEPVSDPPADGASNEDTPPANDASPAP